jgi:uncharacterized protein YbjT (DUF2867 family)
MEKNRTALLLGASGLVGGHVLRFLLESPLYSAVRVLVREEIKPDQLKSIGVDPSNSRLEQRVINFDRLEDSAALFRADDLYSCLGTTIKKAKTKEAFYRVDFTYSFEAAKLAREQGVQRFLLVSSVGADAHSKIFYSQVKGELEEAITQLQFPSTSIFRPSVLLGHRHESRPWEEFSGRLIRPLTGLLIGPLAKYRPIAAEVVAQAMVSEAEKSQLGLHHYDSKTIAEISQTAKSQGILTHSSNPPTQETL